MSSARKNDATQTNKQTNKETNKQTIICITHSILWINVLPGVPTMVAAVFVVVEVILVYKKNLFFFSYDRREMKDVWMCVIFVSFWI